MSLISHIVTETDTTRWSFGRDHMETLLRRALEMGGDGDLEVTITCPRGGDCSGETFDLDEVHLDVCRRVTKETVSEP